jgi:hypothetical protein
MENATHSWDPQGSNSKVIFLGENTCEIIRIVDYKFYVWSGSGENQLYDQGKGHTSQPRGHNTTNCERSNLSNQERSSRPGLHKSLAEKQGWASWQAHH